MFIIQVPRGDLGAQGSFIFSWIMETVMWEEGREKVGLYLLRYSSSLFVIPGKEILDM